MLNKVKNENLDFILDQDMKKMGKAMMIQLLHY